MLTMAELEAEFWGLEREQPTRTRLRRVVERMRKEMLNDEGLFQVWGDEFFNKLLEDDPLPVDAVGLIHKLQTEIGELRTELSRLKMAQAIAAQGLTIVPTCEWVYDSKKIFPWRSGCRNEGFELKPDRTCPQCKRGLVVVDVK